MKALARLLVGCTPAVAASDARIAATVAEACTNPPCVTRVEEPAEIPPAHRAILEAAEHGTSIVETGVRGGSGDPWDVQEMADFLCEEYGYSYRRPDIGPRP